MATPRTSNFTAASGAGVWAGIEPETPLWVPAPGAVAAVNLNTLFEVDPCPAGTCWYSQAGKLSAPWRNWSGAAWCPQYSRYGAMVFWGGGHGGGEDHGVYVFDFTTGLWSRVGAMPPAADYTASLDATWIDYLHGSDRIVPALHTYNYPAYVRPGLPGVGAKGAWLLPALVHSSVAHAPHIVDLETGAMSRYTTNAYPMRGGSPYAGSIEDTSRDVVWVGTVGDSYLTKIDLTQASRTQTDVLVAGGSYAFGGYYARHVYVPEADMAVGFWCRYGETALRGEVIDLATGSPVWTTYLDAALSSFDMTGAGFGIDWCPDKQAYYAYEGSGAARVVKITPSSLDFATCTWSITTETVTGLVNQGAGGYGGGTGAGSQPMSKWRYNALLGCFVWCDGPVPSGHVARDGGTRSGLVQLWRPAGG